MVNANNALKLNSQPLTRKVANVNREPNYYRMGLVSNAQTIAYLLWTKNIA